ncbi:hypothetical protein F6J84_08305 [Microbacterium caowuchunii]|uniref:hypothetical protein n=1 Tax=Microbacterium caowuchunii TaxID=2614638 RepID=UPI001246E9C9|nr:hypothetical protein [Microbacterium caowuchunii]QEW00100.1 hypothetical protein F6J84_08305 [Microbacterium caowuchunii]
MSRIRGMAVAALMCSGVLALSGCTSPDFPFQDLKRDRRPGDELPTVPAPEEMDLDMSTSRFIGEYESASLWLVQGNDAMSICLIIDSGAASWHAACGGSLGLSTSGPGGAFAVVPDGSSPPDGAIAVSENVYAVPVSG